jgi:O-succinylbenzoic acid--CoA ligase
MTLIRCPLQEAAQISGHQPALIREGLSLSFRQIDGLVSAGARRLVKAGVRPGERVGLYLPADWQYPVLFWSLLRAGAVACPLNTRVPARALQELVHTLDCRKLISFTRGGEQHKQRWGVDIFDPESLIDMEGAGIDDGRQWQVDLARPATVLFTSGSGGRPRAVVHSYGNHYYSAKGANANIRLGSGRRWLLSLPLYHVSGLGVLFRCLLGGAAVVLPAHDEELDQSVAKHHITHLSVVAAQLRRLIVAGPPERLRTLEAVLAGGGPIPDALIDRARAMRLPLFTTYGLTELASQVTATRPESGPAERHTAGAVLKHREIRIDERGEILVRGDTLFLGYLEGDRVAPAVDADGWFHTGDLGALDGQGYLTLRGRADNMFVSGGENVYPEEIEQALADHEQIRNAVVVPVPDAEFGHRSVAFVQTANENAFNALEWRPYLESRLPRYKIPVAFYAWPAEAVNGDAKVDRAFFARRACAMHNPENAAPAG